MDTMTRCGRWTTCIIILGVCIFGSQPLRAADAPSRQDKERYEQDLARWKSLLQEYHQGKRDDNDGGAILFHLLTDYGRLGRSNTPEAAALKQEWQQLLAKHPEFRIKPPLHMHEQEAARRNRRARRQEATARLQTFTPADSRIINVLGSDSKMALVYQYHVDFFSLPAGMALERMDKPRRSLFEIRAGGKRIQRREFSSLGLKPNKTLSFQNHIESTDEISGAIDFPLFIWICDDPSAQYSASDSSERELLKNAGYVSRQIAWSHPGADLKSFCGAVSLDGEVVYRLPLERAIPTTVVRIGHTNRDGASIELFVGEFVQNVVDARDAVDASPGETVSSFEKVRRVYIYTYPDKLQTFDAKDSVGIESALKEHDF